jgi:hypothetical protein
MPRRRTGRPRGRPRKANAKRRHTTRVGRKYGVDGLDQGTAELRRKKRVVGRGREDLELHPASVLFGREHIDRPQFDALNLISDTLRRSHTAVPSVNISGLWSAIAAMASRVAYRGPSNDALGLAAANLRRLGWMLRQVDGSKALIIEICEGRCPAIVARVHADALTAEDRVTLETLRRNLDSVIVGPRYRVRG